MFDDVLSLDTRIRDYVLFPISVVMFAQGMLRQYVSQLLRTRPKTPKLKEVCQNDVLRRSRLLRTHYHVIPEDAFRIRHKSLLNELQVLIEKLKPDETEETSPPQSLEDMSGMTDMMRQNVANVLPNMLSMAWVTYFFSGFVLVKLPFPLTDAFKPMLQQGLGIRHLDPSYVSSLSWYFLNLFGMRGLMSLVLGQGNVPVDPSMMYAQMAMSQSQAPNPLGGNTDLHKPFEREHVELKITPYQHVVTGSEYRLLGENMPVSSHND